MKFIAQSPQRTELLRYLDTHDGGYWRYQKFTRPMIIWLSGVPVEKLKENEYFRK